LGKDFNLSPLFLEEKKIERIFDYEIRKIDYEELPDKLKNIKPRINYLRYAR